MNPLRGAGSRPTKVLACRKIDDDLTLVLTVYKWALAFTIAKIDDDVPAPEPYFDLIRWRSQDRHVRQVVLDAGADGARHAEKRAREHGGENRQAGEGHGITWN